MSEPTEKQTLGSNASYCVVFLWHAGEKWRAIGLLRELTRCDTMKQARKITEQLVANYGSEKRNKARELAAIKAVLNHENPCNPPV